MNHEFLKGIHVTKVITEDLLTLVRVTRIYSETGGHRLLQFHIIYYNLKYGALKEIIILHNARPSTLRLQNSELNRDLAIQQRCFFYTLRRASKFSVMLK